MVYRRPVEAFIVYDRQHTVLAVIDSVTLSQYSWGRRWCRQQDDPARLHRCSRPIVGPHSLSGVLEKGPGRSHTE